MKKKQFVLRTVVGSTITGLMVGTPVLWPQLARTVAADTGAPRHTVVRGQSAPVAEAEKEQKKSPGGLVGALFRRGKSSTSETATPEQGSSTAPGSLMSSSIPPAKTAEWTPTVQPTPPAPAPVEKEVTPVAAATTTDDPGFFSKLLGRSGGSAEPEPVEEKVDSLSRRDMRRQHRDNKRMARFGISPNSSTGSSTQTASSQPSSSSSRPAALEVNSLPSHISSQSPPQSKVEAPALDLFDVPFADDAPLPVEPQPLSAAAPAVPPDAPGLITPEPPAAPAPITTGEPAPPVPASLPATTAQESSQPSAESASAPAATISSSLDSEPALNSLDEEESEFFPAKPKATVATPAAPAVEPAAEAPAAEPLPFAADAPAAPAAFPANDAEAPAAKREEPPFSGLKLESSPYTDAIPFADSPAPSADRLAPAPAAFPLEGAPAKAEEIPFAPEEPAFVPDEPAFNPAESDPFEAAASQPTGVSREPFLAPSIPANAASLDAAPQGINPDAGPMIIPQPAPHQINAPATARKIQPSQDSQANTPAAKLARLKERQHQLGLKGFCLVALTDHRDLIDSRPEYSTVFEGQRYYFCSEEALAEFEAAPAIYAPAAGGHDVVHLALTGESQAGSLDYAVWYKGKLYMFQSAETMETFVSAPSIHANSR